MSQVHRFIVELRVTRVPEVCEVAFWPDEPCPVRPDIVVEEVPELPAAPRRRPGSLRRALVRGAACVALLAFGLIVMALAASPDDSDVSVALWACVLVVAMIRRGRRGRRRSLPDHGPPLWVGAPRRSPH